METYNYNSVGFNSDSYKMPFKGENNNAVSNPVDPKGEIKLQKEFASKDYSNATKATAMAQIMLGCDIKSNMTQKEYIDQLMKKGKKPNKDFYIKKNLKSEKPYIEEVNSEGKRIKEVMFFDDCSMVCTFYNPKTQKRYKAISACDGKLYVSYNKLNGEPLLDEVYNSDGTLQENAFYKKTPKGETSVNGDYVISGIEFPPLS